MLPDLRPLAFVLALATIAGPPAFAAAVCTDGLRTGAEISAVDAFRLQLAKDSLLRRANAVAAKAASDALVEAFVGADVAADAKRLVQDVKVLVENPIFDEALARAFKAGGIKTDESILGFQAKLALAPAERQLAFADLVIKQYADLLDQAFTHADEDDFAKIGSRWGLSVEQTYEILARWSAAELTDRAPVRVAVLAWAKAIDPAEVARAVREAKKIPRRMEITDTEEVLLTRIRRPHFDADLAMNRGPISDAQFKWRLRLWNFLGSGQYVLNSIRYPKESAFVIAFSVAPVTLIHAFSKDWNLTNTVATIIGGVATCPPLIAQLTKRAAVKNHEAVFLEVLTLKQLSELGRWIAKHPKRAKEVGFAGLEAPIEARIAVLRSLRYQGKPLAAEAEF